MRRKIAIVAIALSIASAVPSQAESESDQLFLFRDTLWYTRKADMEKSLASFAWTHLIFIMSCPVRIMLRAAG